MPGMPYMHPALTKNVLLNLWLPRPASLASTLPENHAHLQVEKEHQSPQVSKLYSLRTHLTGTALYAGMTTNIPVKLTFDIAL